MPGHLTKDCLNCYSYEKLGHFAQDFSEQDKSTPKQSNAGDCALIQGKTESGTSQVVTGQISITHTSVYTLIKFWSIAFVYICLNC